MSLGSGPFCSCCMRVTFEGVMSHGWGCICKAVIRLKSVRLFFSSFFLDNLSGIPGCPLIYYAAKDDVELTLNLPPPECWDYWHLSPHPVYGMLGIEPKALYMPGRHSIS